MCVVILCLFALISVISTDSLDNVINERNSLLQQQLDMMLGSDIILSDGEEQANDIIMDLKNKELDYGFEHPKFFNVSKHFFEYKDEVKNSKLYQIIQDMPKGAVLHIHDIGILGPDYVVELTYMKHLYVCFEENDLHFLFSQNTPKSTCATKWQLINDARFSSGNVEKFDAHLRTYFTLVIDNPNEVYTDVNTVWKKFQDYFIRTSLLFTYKPVWEQYFYDVLKAFRNENVMYIEIRSTLPSLYDLEGNVYDSITTAEVYKDVLDKFMNDYPDFYGAKLIYAPMRLVNPPTVKEYLIIANEIKKRLPDFFAGFDLVGQEDLGVPLKEFLKELIEDGKDLDYFFHAGETNWNGMTTDENIVDALVLGTRRIGHAFALAKHPLLAKEILKRDIAIEVNVISNAVLKLVADVRNHPLSSFLAQGLPVVLSCDDPGAWEADPISHDFYVAFVGVASRHADIKLLKKLALNSLYYSTIKNKDKVVHEFEIRWTKFIDKVVRNTLNSEL